MSEQVMNVDTICLWIQREKETLQKELDELRSNSQGESGQAKLIRDRLNALNWLEKKVNDIRF